MHKVKGIHGYVLWILVTLVFFIQNDVIAQLGYTDSSDSSKSEMRFLTELDQIIGQDKVRLQDLLDDSLRLEPLFQKRSAQYYQLSERLDSMRSLDHSVEKVGITEHDWHQLQDILDFLLERRRSNHLQLKIMRNRLQKESEVLDFLVKGELFYTVEFTGRTSRQGDLDVLSPDSSSVTDQPKLGREDPEQVGLDKYSWNIVEGERTLERLRAKFDFLGKTWLLADQLMELHHDDIGIARTLAKNSGRLLVKSNEGLLSLKSHLKKLQAGDSAEELQTIISRRIVETSELTQKLKNVIAKDSALIKDLETRIDRLTDVQAPLPALIADAAERVESKERRLEFLRSPFAPLHMYSFLIKHGPHMVLILGLLFLLWRSSRWLTKRLLPRLSFTQYKTREEQKERLETVSRFIQSALTLIIGLTAVFFLLSEFGVNISILLGSAAVFSIAIAFGAQSLIKDFFSGFTILTENQYRVGNVVRINEISGVVEDITLRMTMLRDSEGVAHFIPHSAITVVSNLTYGWSQVSLDIKVSYNEKVDRVMEVIIEVARHMKEDAEFRKLIIGEPEMLGVDAFADSALLVRLIVKTPPQKQWIVKRELLRRIKNRFDELHIEIPVPQQIIFHKNVDDVSINPLSSQKDRSERREEID